MPRVTLSYRRDDSAAIARLMFEHLRSRYGLDNVFVDIDSIEFGEDYRERIYHALGRTDYLLVLIGPKWLGPMGKGRFRIQEANDPVRIEVERALEVGIRVVPILIEHTPMPTPAVLPESLERLAYLNAAEVSVGRDFDSQMDRLTRFIDRTYEEQTKRREHEMQERLDLQRAQIEPPSVAPSTVVETAAATAAVAAPAPAVSVQEARQYWFRRRGESWWNRRYEPISRQGRVVRGIYFGVAFIGAFALFSQAPFPDGLFRGLIWIAVCVAVFYVICARTCEPDSASAGSPASVAQSKNH